jgi:hypothetical protein
VAGIILTVGAVLLTVPSGSLDVLGTLAFN